MAAGVRQKLRQKLRQNRRRKPPGGPFPDERIPADIFSTDFSPRCVGTIPYVKEMFRRCNAKLTVLHVAEIPLYWYGLMPPDGPEAWDSLEDV